MSCNEAFEYKPQEDRGLLCNSASPALKAMSVLWEVFCKYLLDECH